MLKSFIRFTESNIDPLADNACGPDENVCGMPVDSYPLPAVSGDVIKWQMLESQIDTSIYSISDYKIGVVSCGNLVAENIGTIIEAGDGLLQCSVTVPELSEGCYNFIIYTDFLPLDCTIYEGSTLGDIIADGILLGDVINCIPVPDWV